MKKYTQTIIIIAISLIVGLTIGRLSRGTRTNEYAGHDHESAAEEETVWTCSMHPSIRQPEFGDCPICGMDLIPLENEETAGVDADGIRMSEAAMELADIRTAVVGTGSAAKVLGLNGVLVADERRIDALSSHIDGRIEELMLDFTGQSVEKGDTIASIYSPELVTAQKELFEALKVRDTRPYLYNAAITKLMNWKLQKEQINDIIASGKSWGTIPILAERSGIVTGKQVNRGDYIRQGQVLYEISDLSHLWMFLDVYEKDLVWIESGDSVSMEFPSLPGQRFAGTIDYIDPMLDPITRVAKARVNIDNPEGYLKPGLYGSGRVRTELEDLAGLPEIPASAVMWTGQRSLVYVRHISESGLYFNMRHVTLGPKLDNSYVVTDGLEAGEIIAVNGTFSIDAAAQLSGKPSMMNPEGAAFKSTHEHDGMDMSSNTLLEEDDMRDMTTEITSLEVSAEAREGLVSVYDVYLDFKDALVGDNAKQAKRAVLTLKNELENMDMSYFTDDAHRVFMEAREKILMHIPEKKKLTDIERLRTAFEFISDGMIDLIKAFSPQDETLYVQYCPMAFNNKGADWISRDADIKNPYFGVSMLTCGEVIDTLKNLK